MSATTAMPAQVAQLFRRPAHTPANFVPDEITPDRRVRFRTWCGLARWGITPQRLAFVQWRLVPDLRNRVEP